VRITGPGEVVGALKKEGILATSEAFDGVAFFASPHEEVSPMFPQPEQIGVRYLDRLSHPGDSHNFSDTAPVLALPVTAPWGSTVRAVRLAIDLAPEHIIPIHDWHWKDEARQQAYDNLEKVFAKHGITFHKMVNGEPVVLDV
jgi:hypothetical protein